MTAEFFSKVFAWFNAFLAIIGLLIVAALTTPDMPAALTSDLEILLGVIWFCYVLQLVELLFLQRDRHMRERIPAVAVDMLAVVVPLVAFPFAGMRDRSLYCAIWMLKPLRESTFFRLLTRVLRNEARNLIGVISIFGIVLFVAALAAYLIERDVQPKAFGSIPLAMWWAVVTLSTTGYGDEIPQTIVGRILAGVVMMCGIGIFALWAGLLATGFYEEVRRQDFVRNWQLVAAVPLFQKLGSAALVEIVRALRPRTVPPGTIICRKGEAGDQMYFIVEGRVTVATPTVPVELGPGSFFGEIALISGAPRSATVSAATRVSLLALYSADFHMLSSSNPDISDIIRRTALERSGETPEA
jgi:voltage-gated potassium channel